MCAITKKICLLGDFSVGKTSLIRRFVEEKFSDKYLSTVGVKISRKSLILQTETEAKKVELLIWDLEGHTKFKSITPSYLKGASGSVIVGDLTRINTLDNLSKHIELFLEINPDSWVAISLNKADLIQPEKLAQLVKLYGNYQHQKVIQTYLTSAKTGDRVNNLFHKLTKNIVEE
jgi:small GTP-binding protein